MRVPSAKRLVDSFRDLDYAGANLIRRLAKAVDEPDKLIDKSCPATAAYVRRMHTSPYDSHMWRTTVALHAMDKILGMSGVESLGPASGSSHSPPYEYMNAGDAYATTLIYKRATDSLSIGNWGDIAGRHPSW